MDQVHYVVANSFIKNKKSEKQDIQLQLDVFPEISLQDLENKIKKNLKRRTRQIYKNALRGLIEEIFIVYARTG